MLMHLILSLFFICFSYLCWAIPSAVASCENALSNPIKNSDINLLQKENEFKKRLQVIRNSPQEPLLKKKGFRPLYYNGVDWASELNAVAEHLRESKADPLHTHIPYFADQIKKTIADFEKKFKKHNQNNPEWLAERLKILEELKKETRKRIEDQNVTYDWWANFNFRLPMIAVSKDELRTALEARMGYFNLHEPAERIKLGIEIAYNKELVRTIKREMNSYSNKGVTLGKTLIKEFEQLNPEEILFGEFYTSQKLESIHLMLTSSDVSDISDTDNFYDDAINYRYGKGQLIWDKIGEEKGLYNIDFLQTHEGMSEFLLDVFRNTTVHDESFPIIYGIRHFIHLKKNFPQKIMFFTTDELGIMAFNTLESESYFFGVSGESLIADDEEMNALGFFLHDLGHVVDAQDNFHLPQKILEKIRDNISNRSDREEAELALFIYRHELDLKDINQDLQEYYAGQVNGTSPSQRKLRQLRADIKTDIQMQYDNKLLNPNDLQELLPDSLNTHNTKELEKFINESTEILLDILLIR